jgi:hypothetical protein
MLSTDWWLWEWIGIEMATGYGRSYAFELQSTLTGVCKLMERPKRHLGIGAKDFRVLAIKAAEI